MQNLANICKHMPIYIYILESSCALRAHLILMYPNQVWAFWHHRTSTAPWYTKKGPGTFASSILLPFALGKTAHQGRYATPDIYARAHKWTHRNACADLYTHSYKQSHGHTHTHTHVHTLDTSKRSTQLAEKVRECTTTLAKKASTSTQNVHPKLSERKDTLQAH